MVGPPISAPQPGARCFGLAGALLAALLLAPSAAWSAEPACGNPNALGTSRVMPVDVVRHPAIGSFQYPALALAPGEIVLTFDDGPVASVTPRILDILAGECIRATFFMIGNRAEANPAIAARIAAEGHTVASHSYSHPDLPQLAPDQALAELVNGYEAVEKASFGAVQPAETPRFVRFPNFHSTATLDAFARDHDIAIVSADMSPADWRGSAPEATLQRIRQLLDRSGRGIIVLHCNQPHTADFLPAFIDELKKRRMHVVQIVPTGVGP